VLEAAQAYLCQNSSTITRKQLFAQPVRISANTRFGLPFSASTIRSNSRRSIRRWPRQLLRRLVGSFNSSAGSTPRASASLPTIFRLA